MVGGYSNSKCTSCGAEYEREDGLRLTAKFARALRDSWPRPIPVSERLPSMLSDQDLHVAKRILARLSVAGGLLLREELAEDDKQKCNGAVVDAYRLLKTLLADAHVDTELE